MNRRAGDVRPAYLKDTHRIATMEWAVRKELDPMPNLAFHNRRVYVLGLLLAVSYALVGCPGGATPDDPPAEPEPTPGSEVPTVAELTIEVVGEGNVSDEPDGVGIRLVATASPGWRFDRWTGAAGSRVNPLTIFLSESGTVTAVFVRIETPPNAEEEPPDDDDPPTLEGDEDADGVLDSRDRCPGTAASASVDDGGCSAAQRDTDGDNIRDDADECPNTPQGQLVSANGCPVLAADADGDGVPDARDRCPSTPAGSTVDTDGCILAGGPRCGNGIVEAATGEQCEPPNGTSCNANCRSIQAPGPSCGNNTIEPAAGEECEPPNTSECDANCHRRPNPVCGNGIRESGEECDSSNRNECGCDCRTIVPNLPVCGNCLMESGESCDPPDGIRCGSNCLLLGGIEPATCGNGRIEIGEQCDPPSAGVCDVRCLAIVPRPTNDECGNPLTLGLGLTEFDARDATKDGPSEPGDACAADSLRSDVWFCHTAAESAELTVGLCGTGFDATLAVYDGCQCPSSSASVCTEGGCLGDPRSPQLTLSTVAGRSYLFRVGPSRGSASIGRILLTQHPPNDTCANPLALTSETADFSTVNARTERLDPGAPGCPAGDFTKDTWYCFTAECSGNTTISLCNGGYDSMLAVYDGCMCPNGRPITCNDDLCGDRSQVTFETVINRSYMVRIGGFRGTEGVGQITISCTLGNTCGPGNGDCHTPHANPGCDDANCCQTICAIGGSDVCCNDPDIGWDLECVILADLFCP